MPSQRIADTVRAATESSVQSAGGSRLQTPLKDEVTSATCCDDEGKEDDGHDDMRPAAAMGCRHGARRRCLWPMRQEPFCIATALEDGQIEYIFECRAYIVANRPHKRADQSQTTRTEGWRKFRPRQNCLMFFGSKLQMLQQEAESSRKSMFMGSSECRLLGWLPCHLQVREIEIGNNG